MSCARGGSQSAPGTPMRGITTPMAGRSSSGQCHESRLGKACMWLLRVLPLCLCFSLHAVRQLISVVCVIQWCLRHTHAW